MYITLRANSKNKSSVLRAFAPLKQFFNSVMEELPTIVEDTVARVIANVFEGEGPQGDWAPLAPYTQRERARLGYGPEHPILVREGDYRAAFINTDSPHYVSEYESSGGDSFVQRIGTTHPLFIWHEEGTDPPHNMPARPATPIGAPLIGKLIVWDLNEYLKDLLEESLDA